MIELKTAFTALALAGSIAAVSPSAMARDTINVVGSSTVYPFATVVAERFGAKSKFPTPKMESTGSGGGLKIFCQGIGTNHPDITNASRRIKTSELELCQSNGVKDVVEFPIGSDGLVIASSKGAPDLDLTMEQLFLAMGEKVPVNGEWVDNPNKKWSDVDSSLPDLEIKVMGPPPTSGTRDSFNELGLAAGCDRLPEAGDLDKNEHAAICESVREDGAFIEAGENDNLIVQKLIGDTSLYGAFGYSFLDENSDRLKAVELDGIAPEPDAIAAGDYPMARTMFFYVKKAHIGVIPGIVEYTAEFLSPSAMGPNGYLKDVGLIVPTRDRLMALQKKRKEMPAMTMSDLQ